MDAGPCKNDPTQIWEEAPVILRRVSVDPLGMPHLAASRGALEYVSSRAIVIHGGPPSLLSAAGPQCLLAQVSSSGQANSLCDGETDDAVGQHEKRHGHHGGGHPGGEPHEVQQVGQLRGAGRQLHRLAVRQVGAVQDGEQRVGENGCWDRLPRPAGQLAGEDEQRREGRWQHVHFDLWVTAAARAGGAQQQHGHQHRNRNQHRNINMGIETRIMVGVGICWHGPGHWRAGLGAPTCAWYVCSVWLRWKVLSASMVAGSYL
mmetsp:Transcript_33507/g.84339  ORF Transcript_33507/g.84339 Transcript_33507/m.84339 type:complete len:261 (+) Transcript_33507:124-906(+)